MAWFAKRGGNAENVQIADRLRGFQGTTLNSDDGYTSPTLETNNANAEDTSGTSIHQKDGETGGPYIRAVSSGSNFLFYRFKRAKGFFDVVAYTGNGTAGRTVNHSLGVVPEIIIIKERTVSGRPWVVYHKSTTATHWIRLDDNGAATDDNSYWTDTEPTSTQITVGSINSVNGANDYIAYLFASVDGVSKVGSYTGNGSSQNIACGFSAGARFVLIKRTDSSGDWYIWDTERGINTGNDPHLSLNSTSAEVTTNDSIDPYSAGFTVNPGGVALSTIGATYIFLAIA